MSQSVAENVAITVEDYLEGRSLFCIAHWLMASFNQEDSLIEFKSVQMSCNLIDLYEDVVFE